MKKSTRKNVAAATGLGIIFIGLCATSALGYYMGGEITKLAIRVAGKIAEGGDEKLVKDLGIEDED